MGNQTPIITVLMPVYNGEHYLREAIDSILEQTLSDFELLIINDGSTDESEKTILSYDDDRIRYVKNESNLKLIATLNKGLQLSRGKYIARMDADDIAAPTRLAKQLEFMESHPAVGICGTWFESFGSTNSVVKYPISDSGIRYMALYQCPFCHPTVMLRTELIRNHELEFSHDYPHAEDYEFWLRAGRFTELHNLPEVLLKYRQHEESVSVKEASTQLDRSIVIRGQFFHEFGVRATEKELNLFRKMNYHDNDFSKAEIETLGKLICRLSDSNSSVNYIAQDWLQVHLVDKWMGLCLNHTEFGFFVLNQFRSVAKCLHGNTTTKAFLKLLLKSALRYSNK